MNTPEHSRRKIVSRWREPYPLLQPEPNACMSCVTAQILYMAGKTDTPDVGTIDAVIGRKPGQPGDPNAAYLHILDQGLQVTSIVQFDEDRYIKEGISYLKEYYQNEWNRSYDAYFTRKVVRRDQRNRKTYREKYANYAALYSEEKRKPDLSDIENLLRQDYLVDIRIKESADISRHAVLAYGMTDTGDFKLYNPQFDSDGIMPATKDYLSSVFLPNDGIIGIRIPTN